MSLRIALAIATLSVMGCASSTYIDDLAFLNRHTEVIILTSDRTSYSRIVVCPALQGRVMTSTATGEGGLSFGWINRDLIASGEKRKHINAYGGEDRFWLGPEGGQFSIFFAKGEPQTLATWQTPAPIDSEAFNVAHTAVDTVLLRKKMRVVNASGADFELEVHREIRALSGRDPGQILGIEPGYGVRWVGYQSRNRIVNISDRDWKKETGLLSAWILGMFNASPDTTVVVPYKSGPADQLGPIVNDAYFGKVPTDRMQIDSNVIYFKGDGAFRSKIGVSPRRSLGIMGSWDSDNQTLTIVTFNQPKNAVDYVNSMWEIQKHPFAGDAVNSYNDGPAGPGTQGLGPFYELESSSPALSLRPGTSYTHIHSTFHFQGPHEELDKIAVRALGVNLFQINTAFVK